MKRGAIWLVLLLLLSVLTTGCFGKKSPEDVVGDLSNTMEKMTGYKTDAVLTLQTGSTPQKYDVQVWYSKPSNYRVALTSKQRNITQIILKNDEGVFVLTPHLNKSFRFQSGWPENNGPLYLYETLVSSIVDDTERQLKMESNQYVFEVKANYSGNRSLTKQKIWMSEDFKPAKAEIMDTNMNTVVEITFSNFTFNPTFEKDAFDKDRNMTGALSSIPTLSQNGTTGKTPSGPFGVIIPEYVPDGVKLIGTESLTQNGEPVVVLHYQGDSSNYKLMESRPNAATVSYEQGLPVDLGFTIGVLTSTSEQRRLLTWELDGVEYTLTGDLSEEEMVRVASSTYGVSGK
ncbi:DUF4367 domain-containing protein [Brevibacillus sp. B_LB10_24]|uniref:DUF4367 domain-containing protein n=1 Tax=Brevibacillus sp. B_LB10_24 TaxID=3380645 RepID=UPI0038BCBE49